MIPELKNKQDVQYPDREGIWRITSPAFANYYGTFEVAENFEVDVYPLDPVGGILCVWCDDVGLGDITETEFWDSDEWFGHIPVHFLARPHRTFTFMGLATVAV